MKPKFFLLILSILISLNIVLQAQSTKFSAPVVSDQVVFEEKNGLLAVEAEHFYKQTKPEIREWYRTSKNESPSVGRDDDPPHCYGASNNAYIEILPDERVTHSDKIIPGENFTDEPGVIAIVHYKVKINNPGRYFVWVRAFGTGGEDNGLHVGLNGEWPEHGQRMQWCDGRGHWTWGSKQRTKEEHCGVPHEIYLDIEKAGVHEIQFSMREDGFEFDKFVLTNDIDYVPIEAGPEVALAQGTLPAPFPAVEAPAPPQSYFSNISKSIPENKVIASQQFPADGTNFYKNGKNWLAINPKEFIEAQTSTTFNFESGKYDVVFVGVGENDGSSTFKVLINDKEIGTYSPPVTNKLWEEGKDYNALWENTSLKKGDKITVIAKVGSTDGKEHTRGRWAGIIFAPVGKGKSVQDAPSTDAFIH
jgi:hypothetical protein